MLSFQAPRFDAQSDSSALGSYSTRNDRRSLAAGRLLGVDARAFSERKAIEEELLAYRTAMPNTKRTQLCRTDDAIKLRGAILIAPVMQRQYGDIPPSNVLKTKRYFAAGIPATRKLQNGGEEDTILKSLVDTARSGSSCVNLGVKRILSLSPTRSHCQCRQRAGHQDRLCLAPLRLEAQRSLAARSICRLVETLRADCMAT